MTVVKYECVLISIGLNIHTHQALFLQAVPLYIHLFLRSESIWNKRDQWFKIRNNNINPM